MKDKTLEKQPTEYTVKQKACEEGWKLHFDTSKHLTTLSAGSILILIGFLEKVFVRPVWKGLIAVTLGLFVASIIGSVMAMVFISSLVRDIDHIGNFDDKTGFTWLKVSYVAGFVAFLLGVLTLIMFAIKNLFG